MEQLTLIKNEAQIPANVLICGVDEAGRGPLAGPVYAAAVILPDDYDLPYLNDSKKLSRSKREKLAEQIKTQAIAVSVAFSSVEEIDTLNILHASMLAMNRAINSLSPKAGFALIDGNYSNGVDLPNLTVVKGDQLHPCISAASIIAKTARDDYIVTLHELYPQYGFDRHKGYPTAFHRAQIELHGLSPVHRKSFACAKPTKSAQ